MDPLVYSAQFLGYIIGPSLREKKVALIEDINTIQLVLSKKALTAEQFFTFLNYELSELTKIVEDQAEVLKRKHIIDQAIKDSFNPLTDTDF